MEKATMPSDPGLPDDLYERLVDRLRHAEQYAEVARSMAREALSAYRGEVVAMTATPAERVADQLGRAEQYAEACRIALEDALALLETAKREEADDA
jgi:hypothetical protein